MKKKVLSLLLTLCLVMTFVPMWQRLQQKLTTYLAAEQALQQTRTDYFASGFDCFGRVSELWQYAETFDTETRRY